MTCGKGIRSHVGTGSDCTQPSTEECSATTSCVINEYLFAVCFMYGKVMCDVFRQCNTFS